jgi:hypothetical protein
MKRVIKVLMVAALMVVLMAITVSPAFAKQPHSGEQGWGDNFEKPGPPHWSGNWGNGPPE